MNLAMTPVYAGASSFLFAFLILYAIYLRATREKRLLDKRMAGIATGPNQIQQAILQDKAGKGSFKGMLGKAGGFFAKRGLTKGLESQLIKADLPLRGEEFLILWLLAALGPGTFVLLAAGNIILAVLLCFLGVIFPPLLLDAAWKKRLKVFDRQLAESLPVISNALRAGFSFQQCLDMVSREMTDPLAKELLRTYREINLGTTTEQALVNLVGRVASADLELLVTAVLIQRQVGGNLAEIIDNISKTIRERIRLQGEIRTLTAQGRITGLVIGLLPVGLALLLLVLNPGYLEPLLKSRIGLCLLAAGAGSELVGALIIKRIINIEM